MKILLDTHVFIWLVTEDPQLTEKAKKIFLDSDNDIYLSIASIWEMAIKLSIGKLCLEEPLENLLPRELKINGIYILPIELKHVMIVAGLPFHHRDPFDRILIAQCQAENLPILSSDINFKKYEIKRIWE
ncbi:MAG: type II toxin-antitoxin system VapC family toxin [bacterium]